MRLDKILNAVIPGMYDTPCKIAIFTNGRKIKVFEKTCFRSLLRKDGLLKEHEHE